MKRAYRDGSIDRRVGIRRGIYILPNMFTTGSLFCGFTSIIHSIESDFVTAAWLILLAGLFDFLDGRVARLARAESDFGIEYDSLVDLASFGLAPGILVYLWSLSGFERVGWLATFVYFACGALRLARFNVQVDSVEKNFFQGLPIPTAAYTVASVVIFYDHLFGVYEPARSYWMLGLTVVLGFLMVSTVPYRSFKQINLKSRKSFFLLVAFVGVLFIVASWPRTMIFAIVVSYAASGLIEAVFFNKKNGSHSTATEGKNRTASGWSRDKQDMHADETFGESGHHLN